MTPGTYLRLRRIAAGKTVYEVALETSTSPQRDALYRASLIAAIEADRVPVSSDIVLALHEVFAFDRHILVQLVAIHAGAAIAAPDICARCGCSWNDPCHDEHGVSCGWHGPERDLCTACAAPAAAEPLPDLSGRPDSPMPPRPRDGSALGVNLQRALTYGLGCFA